MSNGKPGICEDGLATLKHLVTKMNAEGQQLICALSFDEMAIRRHVQWIDSEKKIVGHINYGFKPDDVGLPVARNSIVFMINGVNIDFNMPIAFYFIKELNAAERGHLLNEILGILNNINIKLIGVTFDGLVANISMCKELGASFERTDFRPYFNNPSNNDKIHIILDPSHMIKLIRNTLARNKVLYDDNNSKIEWKYFEELERFRNERGYTLTHKLSKKHIQWFRAPMRVGLAAETLSNSVADSMEFLMRNGNKEFVNCSATVKFIRIFNNIFDLLNTKEVNSSNMFKSSITSLTQENVFSYFEEAITYIRSLKIEVIRKVKKSGAKKTMTKQIKSIMLTDKRAGFRGFITDMTNLKSIYEECVNSNAMENLHTFRFSQDPLESLFGRIRSLNGFNDNPTVEQFCAAYRKVLLNTEINSSALSNCIDCLNILKISSRKYNTKEIDNCEQKLFDLNEYLDLIGKTEQVQQFEKCNYAIDSLDACSVAYTAGTIELKIENAGRFHCDECRYVFAKNQKISVPFNSTTACVPCESTYQICALAYKHLNTMCHVDFNYRLLLDTILRDVKYTDMYSETNFENHQAHKFSFVIVEEFLRIHANYMAKKATLNEQEKMLRTQLKKIVLLSGQ